MPTTTTTEPVTQEVTELRLDEGESERFAHYAPKEKITEAMVTGTPVTALCGKVWVPSRDPSRYPVCPECKELYELGPEGRMEFWRKRAEQD